MEKSDALQQLPFVLGKTDLSKYFSSKHAGKVRDSYWNEGSGYRAIVATDRISAFDFHVGHIPFKGQVLNQLSAFWFENTKDIVPNHVVAVPDPNVTIAKECKALPLEMVVRGYITGVTTTAMWYQYAAGAREFCGHQLPEGLKKNDRLPQPLITPSTKESGKNKHDRSVSPEELMAEAGLPSDLYQKIEKTALALFQRGSEIAAKAGFILVDTKYEFGLDENGVLTLIDEIHTPDSSRYWRKETHDQRARTGEEMDYFDKENVRLWLAKNNLTDFGNEEKLKQIPADLFAETALKYVAVYEAMTGKTFDFSIGDVGKRIEQSIQNYLRG